MNFKQNKGFVSVDIITAILLLVILVPIITAIGFNISKSNNGIKRKAEALNIATNAIEYGKILFIENDLSEVASDINEFYIDKIYENLRSQYTSEDGATTGPIVTKKDDVLYRIEVTMQDKHEIDNSIEEDKEKILTIVVTYKLGSNTENVQLKTSFVLEK